MSWVYIANDVKWDFTHAWSLCEPTRCEERVTSAVACTRCVLRMTPKGLFFGILALLIVDLKSLTSWSYSIIEIMLNSRFGNNLFLLNKNQRQGDSELELLLCREGQEQHLPVSCREVRQPLPQTTGRHAHQRACRLSYWWFQPHLKHTLEINNCSYKPVLMYPFSCFNSRFVKWRVDGHGALSISE